MNAEPCATEITQLASTDVLVTISVSRVVRADFTSVTLTVVGIAMKDQLANVVNSVCNRKDSLNCLQLRMPCTRTK